MLTGFLCILAQKARLGNPFGGISQILSFLLTIGLSAWPFLPKTGGNLSFRCLSPMHTELSPKTAVRKCGKALEFPFPL